MEALTKTEVNCNLRLNFVREEKTQDVSVFCRLESRPAIPDIAVLDLGKWRIQTHFNLAEVQLHIAIF